jgi:hypothetical protein
MAELTDESTDIREHTEASVDAPGYRVGVSYRPLRCSFFSPAAELASG